MGSYYQLDYIYINIFWPNGESQTICANAILFLVAIKALVPFYRSAEECQMTKESDDGDGVDSLERTVNYIDLFIKCEKSCKLNFIAS